MFKFSFILTFLFSLSAFGLEVPKLTRPVMDEKEFISPTERAEIETSLRNLYKAHQIQVSALLIESLGGQNLEEYSIKVAESWGLGEKGTDRGILLLFAINDRKFRIEVGKGLEHLLTDVESSRIQRMIKPFLKKKEYGKALSTEVHLITNTILKNQTSSNVVEKREVRNPISLRTFLVLILSIASFFVCFLIFSSFLKFQDLNNAKAELESFLSSENLEIYRKKQEENKILLENYYKSESYQEDLSNHSVYKKKERLKEIKNKIEEIEMFSSKKGFHLPGRNK